MKETPWTIGLLLLLLPLWGCGDECVTSDRPTAATCEIATDCAELDCGGICADVGSSERGVAFCANSVCTCPCETCGVIE